MSEQPTSPLNRKFRPRPKDWKPWHPAHYWPEEVYAILALLKCEATPYQQKVAWKWIIEQAGMAYDHSFVPENPHTTAFIEGRRSVGLQILKMQHVDLSKLEKE